MKIALVTLTTAVPATEKRRHQQEQPLVSIVDSFAFWKLIHHPSPSASPVKEIVGSPKKQSTSYTLSDILPKRGGGERIR